MSFPRYPDYKDSGIEWLGHVPAHWAIPRLRNACVLNPSKNEVRKLPADTPVTFLPMEAIGEDGSVNCERERPLGELLEGYTYLRDGDVAIAKITPCFENGKGALMRGLRNGIAFGTTELIVARPQVEYVEGAFLHYLFTSRSFRQLGESMMYGAGGQKRVPDEFLRDLRVPLPDRQEQMQIVLFLDRETAKIDALVAEQQRLIELLQEKRQAVISHAVTKGLNPDVPMKDSGVKWIGEVPAHWNCQRNKVVFREIDERSANNEGELLTVSHITGVTPRSAKSVNMFMAETLVGYKMCRRGDLVINTMWAWMGALGCSPCDGVISPSYNVYRPRPTAALLPEYYDLLCRIPSHRVAMKSNSSGVWESRLRLYPDAFLAMWLALPPLDEQKEIVARLKSHLAQWDALVFEAERVNAMLTERRAALITAAVLGQIDVRGLVPAEAA
jgi:type I restriction enzyme S subunit